MTAAATILRRYGADWEQMAELNLDAEDIAAKVIAKYPFRKRRPLEPEARDVRDYTITLFYIRLLDKSGLRQLNGASLQELLRQAHSLERSVRDLQNQFKQLAPGHKTREERRRELLTKIQKAIVNLDSAQSEFRSATQPGSDPASINNARTHLVAARVVLQAHAIELSDSEKSLRRAALDYVAQDEREDQTLRGGSADRETFDAARSATIQAYSDALNAVGKALQRLDDRSQ